MNCPVCQNAMTTQDVGGMVIDICQGGCKGLWLDWAELKRLERGTESFQGALREAVEAPRQSDENRGALRCPRCSVAMHRHFAKGGQGVSVDECYDCGAFFLDAGELKTIMQGNLDVNAREAYTRQLLGSIPTARQGTMDPQRHQVREGAVRSLVNRMHAFSQGKW